MRYICNANRAHVTNVPEAVFGNVSGSACGTCLAEHSDEPGEWVSQTEVDAVTACASEYLAEFLRLGMMRSHVARYAQTVLDDRAHEAEQARQIDALAAEMAADTLARVLIDHGIVADAELPMAELREAARAAGLIYACLDCGTVGGINPEAERGSHATLEDARVATRDALDVSWVCCQRTMVF